MQTLHIRQLPKKKYSFSADSPKPKSSEVKCLILWASAIPISYTGTSEPCLKHTLLKPTARPLKICLLPQKGNVWKCHSNKINFQVLSWWSYYPVIWGWFHKPWNMDPYESLTGTPNNQSLCIFLSTTISHVKIWFIIQWKKNMFLMDVSGSRCDFQTFQDDILYPPRRLFPDAEHRNWLLVNSAWSGARGCWGMKFLRQAKCMSCQCYRCIP